MDRKLFQSCPRCERAAARRPPWLTTRELLAFLCHDPRHIDLDGKARDPNNLPRVAFQAGSLSKQLR